MCISIYTHTHLIHQNPLTERERNKHYIKLLAHAVMLIENFFVWRNLQTDTASVLTEAIGYIQFLHDQIQVIFHFPTFCFAFSFVQFEFGVLTHCEGAGRITKR